MYDHSITSFEVIGDPSTIQKMEDEYFTHQTWETWSDTIELWGLDFNKVIPTPHSLMLEIELIESLYFDHPRARTMLSELFYPTRKTRPTVKMAMAELSFMHDLLPSKYARPKNLYQVMALLRQTEAGRKLIFLNHLHYRNCKHYGKDALRNWRSKHWGSSVPSMYFEVFGKGRYLLHTLYNPPLKVFQKLSELFPLATINVRYMDNMVRGGGTRTWQGGDLLDEATIDAKKFALEQFFGTKIRRKA